MTPSTEIPGDETARQKSRDWRWRLRQCSASVIYRRLRARLDRLWESRRLYYRQYFSAPGVAQGPFLFASSYGCGVHRRPLSGSRQRHSQFHPCFAASVRARSFGDSRGDWRVEFLQGRRIFRHQRPAICGDRRSRGPAPHFIAALDSHCAAASDGAHGFFQLRYLLYAEPRELEIPAAGFPAISLVRYLEALPSAPTRKTSHGWGIMADDWMAGIYAAILLRAALHFGLLGWL